MLDYLGFLPATVCLIFIMLNTAETSASTKANAVLLRKILERLEQEEAKDGQDQVRDAEPGAPSGA